jgi:hypothetical protein
MDGVSLINWACIVRQQLEQLAIIAALKAAEVLAWRHHGVVRIAG